jgi:selenocysteine-specific elongation factor
MPVLRSFVAPGRGAVVTGIPLSGVVHEGEAVEILPGARAGRVRSIQVHKRATTEARAHRRTALALSDVEADRIHRGMVVAAKGALETVRRAAVRVRLLADGRPLEHRDRVRLHVGAAQVVARVHLLRDAALAPGEEGIVELEAFEDVVVIPGDRFVLREENASATLGGGVIVELLDRRLPRRREGIVRALREQGDSLHDPAALVAAALAGAADRGMRPPKVAARTGLRAAGLDALVDGLVAGGRARRLGHAGDLWIDEAAFQGVLERIEAGARRAHEKDPALAHLPVSTVRTAAGRLEPAVLDAALDHLVREGRLRRDPTGGIRLASHEAALSDGDARDMERVRDALARGAGQPPAVEDLEADLALTKPRVLRVLKLLQNRAEVLQAGEFYFDGAWVDEAKRRLGAHADVHGGFTPADARTLLDTTRKWVIPLLEALDRSGFSRRRGDRRVVVGRGV